MEHARKDTTLDLAKAIQRRIERTRPPWTLEEEARVLSHGCVANQIKAAMSTSKKRHVRRGGGCEACGERGCPLEAAHVSSFKRSELVRATMCDVDAASALLQMRGPVPVNRVAWTTHLVWVRHMPPEGGRSIYFLCRGCHRRYDKL